ncbi:ROK family protein (plasmid) [Deinococcus metallilatus]|uniref:NBD/HSP70 family sugar kinase n=1 Tax=Deinococcus metallilatus TaxID=1211322 RepID=A0AAJ5F5Y1_9DEIO|nr:ROK family protein [Deinococcus metallilatus]MBB5293512.1 putative NBD/HSP70 family sugar kinase [Deinococcus metallilatus]QBY06590.1 ROK family protein [Deinococcus metallilatus]RXJ17933.1 ROK family protein [Deinococcus metallilatus]TLK32204.1 ROK family protein [Deinococcus metallilatus]GMA15268.1 transcriptional regulator [Deinococcus metallilatus]
MRLTARQKFVEAFTLHQPISRVQMAEITGLSKGAVSVISRELIEQGAVKEYATLGPANGQFGRPSVLLELAPESAFFVGVCIIQGAPLLLVLTDLLGNVIREQRLPLPGTPEQVAQVIRDQLPALRGDLPPGKVRGIGLALSGAVDHLTGICLHSANLGWQDVPIAALVEEATGLPTWLENDAHAIAISERFFGRSRSTENFSVVTVGYSIGCAHFVGGELYRGYHGGAGEIAHLTVQPGGERCRCGKRGCLDTLAAHSALERHAREAGLGPLTVRELDDLAEQGDRQALALLTTAGEALGLALAHIVQINRPEQLLILDEVSGERSVYQQAMRAALEDNILPRFRRDLNLVLHQEAPNFRARGAASVASRAHLLGLTGTPTSLDAPDSGVLR